MWGGRFESGPAAIMREITPSIDFDKRLAAEDLAGSRAHCRMLANEGIISKDDGAAILDGLAKIEKEITEGSFVFKRELEGAHAEGGLFELAMHPHVITNRSRLWILEELIRHARSLPGGVWFARHDEIAAYALQHAGGS